MPRSSQDDRSAAHGGPLNVRTRTGRLLAGTVAATMAVTGLSLVSAESASAAASDASAPLAQAVGRLADGTIGSNTLESLADVKDARATAPPDKTSLNPLDVTLLGRLNVPLTGAINIPSSPAIQTGAVNQVAVAKSDGYSVGASGAVQDTGGANLGNPSNGTVPTFAEINLSPDAIPTGAAGTGLSLPGGALLAALGGITASIGAVYANAQTKAGGDVVTPQYGIAGLSVKISSPALGGVLKTLAGLLMAPPSLSSLSGGLPPGITPPASCTLQQQVLTPLSLDSGAITLDGSNAAITIDLAKLLDQLGLKINDLPANTDLVAYLLNYLASPDGLAKGLQSAITNLTSPLQAKGQKCIDDILAAATVAGVPSAVTDPLKMALYTLFNGEDTLTSLVNMITTKLASTAGANPLKPLADGLRQVIDIGINVESGPGIQKEQTDPALKFTTALQKTPNQATPVVKNQTLIRALEIHLLNGAPSLPGLPALPGGGLGSLPIPIPNALAAPVAGGTGVLTLALANAAVGPSSAAPTTPPASTTPASPHPPTQIPTGVNAGAADHGGTPTAPIVLLIVAVLMAGAGAMAWRVRGRHLT